MLRNTKEVSFDAESQQSLPFATIYVDADHKALANANGEFSIETSATGHAKD